MTSLFTELTSWKGSIPQLKGRSEATLILPVPLDPFAPINVEEVLRYLVTLQKMMTEIFKGKHEILLVPFGEKRPSSGSLLSRLTLVTYGHKTVRWIKGYFPGLGSAVREAVFLSHGQKILVGSLECHYDPTFFREAVQKLDNPLVGIVANRRLPDSEFVVPVSLLSLVYRRHLLGVALSQIWSRLFSLSLTDNLSGAYVLQRPFALKVFNRLTCPLFLYEAEMAIVAKANHCKLVDHPARFFLEREKPRLRVYAEIFSVIRWTLRFFRNVQQRDYDFLKFNRNHLTADDWGMSPAVNDAILEMAELGHLRRISVLAGGKYMTYRLNELKRVEGVEFGLHFNLTNPESGGIFRSLRHFLLAWYKSHGQARRELVRRIQEELLGQLAMLRRYGVKPLRLEGHHHVHAIPGLLDEIQDILKKAGIRQVRVPYHRSLWFSTRAPLAWFGKATQKAVKRLGFDSDTFYYPTERDFKSFNHLVRRLNRTNQAEVIIHPAVRNDIARESPSDNYRQPRVVEFNLLRLLAIELRSRERSKG